MHSCIPSVLHFKSNKLFKKFNNIITYQKHDMGGACGTNTTGNKGKRHFGRRACVEGTAWRTARGWRDNIKMKLG